ncbi:hypothetical protein ACFVVM_31940 [Nocardia sp. NPDC058176]|uniref:hypothetical protein n=1 Tax=Nocardia sp. NPDC058176 TaxID=3346368 RepID=UPI0036D84CE6
MMKSGFGLPMLVAVATAVGACSTTVTGTPEPDTTPTMFGLPVTTADKVTFDTLDQVRSVDPCGFVDRARFAEQGVITLLGPSTKIDQCAVGFTPNGERNGSFLYVDLDHQPPLGTDTSRQIAGESIVVSGPDTYGNCDFKVPLRFPMPASTTDEDAKVVEVPTLAYASVSSSSFDSSELGCRLAEDIVVEIVEAFRGDRIPRRSAAATPVSDIAVMARNPCEIVAVLPAHVRLDRLEAAFEPTECSFWVAGSGPIADPITIGYEITRRPLAPTGTDRELIEADGVPVLVYRQPLPDPMCVETFATGAELDPTVGGTDHSGAVVQPIVRISGSCAVTEQIRPAAMHLFGATA